MLNSPDERRVLRQRRGLSATVALVAAIAAVLIGPPASSAQTVTIGSALPDNVPTSSAIVCGDACTTAIGVIPGRPVTSTCDGTIVRWRVRVAAPGGGTAQAIELRVIRPLGGDLHAGAGSSGSQTLSTVSGEIQEFAANLPIKAGDSIGLDTPEGEAARIVIPTPGASVNRFLDGTLPDGEPRTASVNDDFELLLNADVECTPPPPPPPPPPSNDFSFGQVTRNEKRGTAKLTVKIEEGPGELELAKTRKVQPAAEQPQAAGEVTLRVKPTGKTKRRLERALDGKKKATARVEARVTYSPTGGEPSTKTRKLTLIKR